jgi:Putative prokaryotic signal transducing protein
MYKVSRKTTGLDGPTDPVRIFALCNRPSLAYDFPTVKPRDPEEERRRLAELYSSMTEGELRKIAEDPKSLAEPAIESLNKEFARRNLDVELEIPKAEQEQSHPEISDLVILRHFRDLPEALLAKGGLESAGIECFFDDDNIVRMDWFISNAVGGIKLLVRPEDFEAANEILEQGVPTGFDVPGVGEYEQPFCPKCNSLDITLVTRNKVAVSGAAGFGLSSLIDRDYWKCNSCGHGWDATRDEASNP